MNKKFFILIFFNLFSCTSCSGSQISDTTLSRALQQKEKFDKSVKIKDMIIIIDYKKSLLNERLWVYDLKEKKVIFSSHVGHAGKSGIFFATNFSNTNNSEKSSVGSFITLNSYKSKFGESLRIQGLEQGQNDNVLKRAIIIHPMTWQPWSLGCFTIPKNKISQLIKLIKNGVFMYVDS